MLFTSIDFAVFLAVVFSLYWLLNKKVSWQNTLILVASYFFYGYWDARFLYLIVLSTTVDFLCGLMIDKGKVKRAKAIESAIFLFTCTFLFLIVPTLWESFHSAQSTAEFLAIAFEFSIGWQVLAITPIVLFVAWLIYPKLVNLDVQKRRKLFVTVSIVTNLSILGFFKYFNFFAESFSDLSIQLFGIAPNSLTLDIILPVGISFYTFQTMSYTIDVYRRELKSSDKLNGFAAYVSFFPQLVAGPIERGKHLLPQFQLPRAFPTGENLTEGVWLIVWGLFKKLVIADNVALIANTVFAPYDAGNFSNGTTDGLTLLIAVYAFAIQIYCDFSGYTDIARGTAKLFGFDLMVNFRLPYFAADPSSFWRRWHISLSTWLRDYLYIPLGGNRDGNLMTYRNLSLTMLLGGLWHGAAWTFVVWGLYHGALLSIYRALGIDTERPGYPHWKRFLMTLFFFHLTCIGWLIFRAQNMETIGLFLSNIVFNPIATEQTVEFAKTLLFYSWFLIGFQVIQFATKELNPMKLSHWFVRLNVWHFIIMSLVVFAASGTSEFIYFAF